MDKVCNTYYAAGDNIARAVRKSNDICKKVTLDKFTHVPHSDDFEIRVAGRELDVLTFIELLKEHKISTRLITRIEI